MAKIEIDLDLNELAYQLARNEGSDELFNFIVAIDDKIQTLEFTRRLHEYFSKLITKLEVR